MLKIKKCFVLMILGFLVPSGPLWAQSQIPTPQITDTFENLLTDAWFSEAGTFPMNTTVCIQGECTAGGLKRHQIVLTFDDGPAENTRRILQVLETYRVRATFFVHVGARRLTPTQRILLDEIHHSGHKIANHGSSHEPLNGSTSSETVTSMLMDTHNAIAEYYQPGDIPVYRNPGGYWSGGRARLLNEHNTLRTYVGPIFWNVGGDMVEQNGQTIDAADWRCRQRRLTPSHCATGYFNAVMNNFNSGRGSLILMHDIHPITVDMLPLFFDKLMDTGLRWEFLFVQDIPAVREMITEI